MWWMVPFFPKQGIIKKIGFPLKLMTSSWCYQMCMNGKVNQGPLYDINVWCNRSLETKLHPIIGNRATLNSTISISIFGAPIFWTHSIAQCQLPVTAWRREVSNYSHHVIVVLTKSTLYAKDDIILHKVWQTLQGAILTILMIKKRYESPPNWWTAAILNLHSRVAFKIVVVCLPGTTKTSAGQPWYWMSSGQPEIYNQKLFSNMYIYRPANLSDHKSVFCNSKKCIFHTKVYFTSKSQKAHIIQLLNTKTNTTDVLGNKFYKTQSLFFYLTMWTHIYHWSVLSDYFLSCPCNGSGFGSATSKILDNFTVWKHGLYHFAEAIRTRKWHIAVNYIQCPKCLCPDNIVVGRQRW